MIDRCSMSSRRNRHDSEALLRCPLRRWDVVETRPGDILGPRNRVGFSHGFNNQKSWSLKKPNMDVLPWIWHSHVWLQLLSHWTKLQPSSLGWVLVGMGVWNTCSCQKYRCGELVQKYDRIEFTLSHLDWCSIRQLGASPCHVKTIRTLKDHSRPRWFASVRLPWNQWNNRY
jgi:hypothetical protein